MKLTVARTVTRTVTRTMKLTVRRRVGLVLAGVLCLPLAACGALGRADQTAGGQPTADGDQTLVASTSQPPVDPPPAPEPDPAPEDCVSYDPANLTVAASGDAWVLRDGGHQMKLFDTQADAEDGRRVARNWSQLCFIGRAVQGPDRYRHIVHYFAQPSGLPLGPAPATLDCIPYDPDDLAIYHGPGHPANPDENDWALFSGGTPLLFLANQPDALRARIVASQYTRLCVIGSGNDRPDPFRYRMLWWRP